MSHPILKSPDTDLPVIPVTATRKGRQWFLHFAAACPFCGGRHQHGGLDGPEPYTADQWVSHCQSDHKAFRPDCVPEHSLVTGQTRCHVEHGSMYELYLVEGAKQ